MSKTAICIAEKFMNDPRYWILVEIMSGDQERALGRCTRLWMLARPFWLDGKKLIPRQLFSLGKFEHMLEVGLAEERPDGIYAKGLEEAFEWYFTARENGKKGGRPPKQGDGAEPPEAPLGGVSETKPKPNRNPPLTNSEPNETEPEPSGPISSYCISSPLSEIKKHTTARARTEPCVNDPGGGTRIPGPGELVAVWNELCGEHLAKMELREVPLHYQMAAQERLADEPDLNHWREVVKRIAKSPHCTGRSKGGWRADFLWLVKDEEHHRAVMLGRYDAQNKTGTSGSPCRLAFLDPYRKQDNNPQKAEASYHEPGGIRTPNRDSQGGLRGDGIPGRESRAPLGEGRPCAGDGAAPSDQPLDGSSAESAIG